jgi:hypothetical protein
MDILPIGQSGIPCPLRIVYSIPRPKAASNRSDSESGDAPAAAQEFSVLNNVIIQTSGKDLELHVIAFFRSGADRQMLPKSRKSSFD